ncbi:Flp pilus assembly protein CpaB [Nocardioides bigeumensis]|uniref:SAF domain-containing protein n=1 Tax=Nocardioides bigeumensis TaxID=433657 RepID=A0ABP5JET5_9ACTN
MDRRKILLAAAAIVAALGAVLVFLYVRGADLRAEAEFDNRDVLKVVTTIEQGETIEDAAAAGKIQLQAVPANQVLPDALASTSTLSGKVAVTTIYPGEQVISSKFGGASESVALPIAEGDIAISVSLSDTARVAGFVNPGSEVAIFLNGADAATGQGFTRLLLPRVTVIGVGSTTPITTTTTTEEGATQTENLPRTILTLTLPQGDAQRVMFAQTAGELSFALLNEDSEIGPNPGANAANLFNSEE